jgi:hypothetical protein
MARNVALLVVLVPVVAVIRGGCDGSIEGGLSDSSDRAVALLTYDFFRLVTKTYSPHASAGRRASRQ